MWHGGLHTTVQQWTDMNCAITGQSDFFAAAPLVQSGNAVVAQQPTPGRAFVCLVAASAPLGTGRARAMVSGAFLVHLSAVNLTGGGLAYFFTFAMAATSNDRAARWLGPARWRRFHQVGSWWIWIIFAQTITPAAWFVWLPLISAALLRMQSASYARQHR